MYYRTRGPSFSYVMASKQCMNGSRLDSVKDRLVTDHGIVLLDPPFTKYYLNLGEISSYPPGYKENGSVFCHTNPWIMIAEVMHGNGNQALDYYLRINPSFREELSDIHRSEPYVYCQTIAGKNTTNQGEGKNSWLTGTSAWTLDAITHWILGVKPTFNGLEISPVVPEDWNEFKVTRIFRNNKYNLIYKRVGKGNAVTLIVDGNQLRSNIIPVPQEIGKTITVSVELGSNDNQKSVLTKNIIIPRESIKKGE